MDEIWIAPHAITRFCQRILDIGNVYAEGNARIVAEAHCAAAGLEYEAVRKMIATPKVKAELSMGKAQCRERHFTAIFDGGNIITILPAKAKKPGGVGGKIYERKEGKRERARQDRRNKQKQFAKM
jgi:hypothetical protein